MTDSIAEIKTQTPPSQNAPDKGVKITGDFPLTRLSTSIPNALKLNNLEVDAFTERQYIWLEVVTPLLDLIDKRSEITHLTDNPNGYKMQNLSGYMDGFKNWRDQVDRYASTIDAQAMLSDGLNPKDVADFKRRMAQTAISERLITPEDCERLGIVIPKETTAPPEK